MFGDLVMCHTDSEKLHRRFLEKRMSLRGHWEFEEYIVTLDGLEYVKKRSRLGDELDYLLEVINRGDFNRYVVRCPSHERNFIILTKDAAERVLAIGLP